MKQRLRLTFILADLAALSIIIFQVYWGYNNFVNAQRHFTIKSINALDKSIQRYQLQQIELPTSFNYKVPSLTVFMRTKPDNEALALDTPSSRGLLKLNIIQ